jgi:hypothetical protein
MTHNTVHVQVEVVELDIIGVWARDIHRDLDLSPVFALHFGRLLLSDRQNYVHVQCQRQLTRPVCERYD